MSSDYMADYVPTTPTSFARPVQDEVATGGLSGCETPAGAGILLWDFDGEIHCAVVSSPMDFIVDDIVPAANIRVVATGLSTIYGTSVQVVAGDLFCVSHEHTPAGDCEIIVRIADDPENPTTWTVHGTVYSAFATGPYFGIADGSGTPLILDSGRWVYAGKTCDGPLSGAFEAVNVRIFTSDDNGVSWEERLVYGHPYIFPRTEGVATTMARDPITGYLWTNSGTGISGPSHNNTMWHSTNDGTSWTIGPSGESWFSQPHPSPAISTDTNVYALANEGTYVYDGTGTAVADWVGTGTNWFAPGVTLDPIFEQSIRANITSFGVFFFVRDQVMFTPGNPTPSFVIPLLHIPYKDRLKNVTLAPESPDPS